jgi:bifunctional N-acetylglucosamine-1-phosphate-uridyltransferase/glucosamine-1-phosphate-acetyltransferase GlmU-like protein
VTWRAVVAALDDGEAFRSRVSMYLHPLAGRPVLWHVLAALFDSATPPVQVRVLHRADSPLLIPDLPDGVQYEPVERGAERRALRTAVAASGRTLLVDGVAALLTGATFGRLLRASQVGVASIAADQEHLPALAVAGDGPVLAAAEDPRHPRGGAHVATSTPGELRRIVDRHSLAEAGVVVRDRLVRRHEDLGVSFILPATVWLDVDVRIGTDSVIYPGVVIEGATVIGSECVIGPYSRIVEASIGRGVELSGWNHVQRTTVRNQAVLEPYARRGLD